MSEDQALQANMLQALAKEGLSEASCADLVREFGTPFVQATELVAKAKTIEVTDETQTDAMKEARIARLAIRNVRTTTENIRKRLKEDSLRRGQSIDKVARMVKDLCEPEEERLEQCEKFAELAETKRKADRAAERAEQIRPYADPSVYADLGGMSDEQWAATFTGAKAAHQARKEHEEFLAKERAEAEARRQQELAEARELARVAAEEARKAREASERIERESRENARKLEAERDAERAKAREADEARQRAEEKAKNDEAARRAEAEERDRQRMADEAAPDAEKLRAWAASIRSIQGPEMRTAAGRTARHAFLTKLERIAVMMGDEADRITAKKRKTA